MVDGTWMGKAGSIKYFLLLQIWRCMENILKFSPDILMRHNVTACLEDLLCVAFQLDHMQNICEKMGTR